MKTRRTLLLLSGVSLSAITTIVLWPESGPQSTAAGTRHGAVRPRPAEAPLLSPTVAATAAETPDARAAKEALPQPDFSKLDAFDNWLARWQAASLGERVTM